LDNIIIYYIVARASGHLRTHSHTRAGLARIRRDKAL